MTDQQIVQGILDNDERAWRYIYANMRGALLGNLRKKFSSSGFSADEWNDVFVDTCEALMVNVKRGKYEKRDNATLYTYILKIAENTTLALLRKKKQVVHDEDISKAKDEVQDEDLLPDEKQRTQNEFLDRVLESIPEDCRLLLKKFYWDRIPMERLAPMFGYKNADNVANKKNKCMKKIKDVKERLLEDGDFDEDTVKAAVERAALRELLESERIRMEEGYRLAALDMDDKEDN